MRGQAAWGSFVLRLRESTETGTLAGHGRRRRDGSFVLRLRESTETLGYVPAGLCQKWFIRPSAQREH